jgi:hypothetical protein
MNGRAKNIFLFFISVGISFFSSREVLASSLSVSMTEAVEKGLQHNSGLLLAKERLVSGMASFEGEQARYAFQHNLETTKKRTTSESSEGSKSQTDLSSMQYDIKGSSRKSVGEFISL